MTNKQRKKYVVFLFTAKNLLTKKEAIKKVADHNTQSEHAVIVNTESGAAMVFKK